MCVQNKYNVLKVQNFLKLTLNKSTLSSSSFSNFTFCTFISWILTNVNNIQHECFSVPHFPPLSSTLGLFIPTSSFVSNEQKRKHLKILFFPFSSILRFLSTKESYWLGNYCFWVESFVNEKKVCGLKIYSLGL
jgi:hypothetical protein